jgi:hypothetical protein
VRTLRIAISGTHRIGKTTLVDAFAAACPGYSVIREPYEVLVDELGEEFDDDLAEDSFQRQLEYQLTQLSGFEPNANVIFDRCPVDFLAYMMATSSRRPAEVALPDNLVAAAHGGLEYLDLVVFLPLRLSGRAVLDAEEDLQFRREADRYLRDLISDDGAGLFSRRRAPRVLELGGPTPRRLRELLDYVHRYESGSRPVF